MPFLLIVLLLAVLYAVYCVFFYAKQGLNVILESIANIFKK